MMPVFAPKCGTRIVVVPVRATVGEKRGFRIAGGVLSIIAACICIITGLIGLAYHYTYGIATLGIPGLIAFAFGLTAGILTLMRRVFALAIIGEIFVMVAGVLAFIPVSYTNYYAYYIHAWPAGIFIFLLILLGLIFTALARADFVT